MLKEGYFSLRHDQYGQTLRSRGYVGTEPWISANLSRFNLGTGERLLYDELHRSNRELRAVLSFGGVVTYRGDILAIGLTNVTDKEFLSSLHEEGVEKCTVSKTEKLLGIYFPTDVSIRHQTKINFYTPQLDGRLSFSTTKGSSFCFHIDGDRLLHREFVPFQNHLDQAIFSIKLPKEISISTGTFLNQVLAEASLEKGSGYVPY